MGGRGQTFSGKLLSLETLKALRPKIPCEDNTQEMSPPELGPAQWKVAPGQRTQSPTQTPLHTCRVLLDKCVLVLCQRRISDLCECLLGLMTCMSPLTVLGGRFLVPDFPDEEMEVWRGGVGTHGCPSPHSPSLISCHHSAHGRPCLRDVPVWGGRLGETKNTPT